MQTLPRVAVLASSLLVPALSAETIATNASTFEGLEQDAAASVSAAAGGVTMTLTAGSTDGQRIAATGLGGDDGSVGIVSDSLRNPNLQVADEVILTFDRDVMLESLDLAGVGDDPTDSAQVTIGEATFEVFGNDTVEPQIEGVTYSTRDDMVEFAGEAFRVRAGEEIVLSNVSTGDSAYALSAVTFSVVEGGGSDEAAPEPD